MSLCWTDNFAYMVEYLMSSGMVDQYLLSSGMLNQDWLLFGTLNQYLTSLYRVD